MTFDIGQNASFRYRRTPTDKDLTVFSLNDSAHGHVVHSQNVLDGLVTDAFGDLYIIKRAARGTGLGSWPAILVTSADRSA